MISVVSPVFNEEESVEELVSRITSSLRAVQESYEILLVDDNSSDGTLDIIKRIRETNSRVKYISLSRNFGHQGAIWAGVCSAAGDAVVTMDGDLQHPPELLPKMIAAWREGNHVVFMTKQRRNTQRHWIFYPSLAFYWAFNKLSDVKLSFGQSDFRLLDRRVVNVLTNIPEKGQFLRGMVEWVGFKQTGFEYEVAPRRHGVSKWALIHRFSFAFDGLFSFSTMPLRVVLVIGVIMAIGSTLYAAYEFVRGILATYYSGYVSQESGYATLVVAIFFLGAVQLIGIGVLGEYIGRIYSQTKGRPDFIVREQELQGTVDSE